MTRWQKQTSFGGPDSDDPGNCWACCIGGMLNIPPSHVPEGLRLEKDDDKRFVLYRDFLREHGYTAVSYNASTWTDENWGWFWDSVGDALIHFSGDSPRGSWTHGVIYQNGKLLFDPHPSGHGLKKITGVEFLIPLDPANMSMVVDEGGK